jgi:1-acyl-sn-glycerol-3-phosphate acyltransferase
VTDPPPDVSPDVSPAVSPDVANPPRDTFVASWADSPSIAEPVATGSQLVPIPRDDAGDGDDASVRDGDVDGWGRSEHLRAIARRLYDPVYRRWFRVEWEGLEHVPRDGGALLVANHGGAIPSDAPVIMHGVETELGRPVYGMADNLFRAVPGIGTLWSRTGGVPAHPDNAYRLLHDEQQLALVFPEGTKATGKLARDRYRLRRFGRGGFVEIAMRSGVPIVPIAIVGNEEAMPIVWKSPRLAKLLNVPYVPVTANMFLFGPVLGLVLPLPAKFRLRVLPPVHFDVAPNQERYNRSVVMEHAEAIREMIQNAVNDLLRARKSVWFG